MNNHLLNLNWFLAQSNIFSIFQLIHPIRHINNIIIARNIKTWNKDEIDLLLYNVYKSFLDKITEKMSDAPFANTLSVGKIKNCVGLRPCPKEIWTTTAAASLENWKAPRRRTDFPLPTRAAAISTRECVVERGSHPRKRRKSEPEKSQREHSLCVCMCVCSQVKVWELFIERIHIDL